MAAYHVDASQGSSCDPTDMQSETANAVMLLSGDLDACFGVASYLGPMKVEAYELASKGRVAAGEGPGYI
jgi:hypothetical protein